MTAGEKGQQTGETRLALAVALGGLVVVLDTTVTVVAVPVLVVVLDAPLSTLQWTTTAYLLALFTTLPLSAGLSARFGTRRTYVAALGVFAVGSVLATVALGPATLVAARVVQGLGGGLVNPVGTVLALRDVPARRRGRVASLLGLPLFAGVLGPVLAGWLIDAVSWRAIFAMTVPPAVLGAVLVHRWARPDPPRSLGRSRPDLAGAVLLVAGVVAVVYAAGEARGDVLPRLGLLATGLALVAAFALRSARRPQPLVDVRLLGRADFRAGVLVLVLYGASYFGAMLLMPSYVQTTRGGSATLAGTLMAPAALATGVTLQVATRLVDRVPVRRIAVTGLVVSAVAGSLTALVLRGDTPFAVVAGLGALLGVGSGAVLVPTMTAATRPLTGDALASGSTLLALAQQGASALGVAAITGVYAALTPTGAATGELVDAQRLTQLVVVALVLAALAVALTRLPVGRPGPTSRKEHDDEHQPASAR